MKRVHLEWNINCGNDAKNDYKDDHEVRCEYYKINDNEFVVFKECEVCDYRNTETSKYLNVVGENNEL